MKKIWMILAAVLLVMSLSSISVAEKMETETITSGDWEYVEMPGTSPKASNGVFCDIIYGTPYSEIKDQLIETYGQNYKIDKGGSGFTITFNNPGISVAGHDVISLGFSFCYDLNKDGTINKDEASTSFIQGTYCFDTEQNSMIIEDLYSALNKQYGQTYYRFGEASSYDWRDNDMYDGKNKNIFLGRDFCEKVHGCPDGFPAGGFLCLCL